MRLRHLMVLAAAMLAAASHPASATEPAVRFRVSPVAGATGLEALEIEVAFSGDPDGSTRIALPRSWAGIDRLHERIEALAVEGGVLTPDPDAAMRTVTHRPGAPLRLRYRIGGVAAAEPDMNYEKARPLLRPDWFYVHGEGAFAVPADRGAAPARFSWGRIPVGWRVAGDVETAQGLTVDGVARSILTGGTDLRLLERSVGGAPVRLALRGRWSFDDAALAEALVRIIAAQNAYFEAPAIPFLVTLAPLTGGQTGAISYGGTGRTAGFALAATTNVGLADFLPTLAHEYGHRWFGGSLGPVPDPDAPDYWFTEGFGDYVAALVLVRAGLWGEAEYRDHLNAVLLRYGGSPAHSLANDAVAERFWSDPAAMQMPYDRGHLFALTLDAAAVRQALVRMATRGADFPSAETQARRFVRAYGLSDARLAPMLAGTPVALPPDLLAPCGTLAWAEQPAYAPGYTAEDGPNGRVFATVDESGPAWAAGLRPGMRYVRRLSFRPNDSSVPIVMRVADDQGERELSWLPQGRERIRFQRLELQGTAGDACRRRLAGAAGAP